MARPAWSMALNKLDFADVRLAGDRHACAFANQTASPGVAQQLGNAALDAPQRRRRLASFDEVITLVRKVERRLEPRDQVEQLSVDPGDSIGERAFELVKGRARLQRSDRVDEIGHRLGLHEIDPPVQERAQREFARLGEACAGFDCALDDRPKHDRAAVRADLDDVFAGVGVRRGKVGRDHLIGVGARKGCVTGLKRTLLSRRRLPAMSRADDPLMRTHTDAAPSRRRRNGHDRVVSRNTWDGHPPARRSRISTR